MKKVIFTIFIFLLPIYVLAYSKNIIPGGESIGIRINSSGLVVVGYYKVDNDYINKNIHIGDRIIKIDDKNIDSINDMINILNTNKSTFNIELIRNKKLLNENLILKEIFAFLVPTYPFLLLVILVITLSNILQFFTSTLLLVSLNIISCPKEPYILVTGSIYVKVPIPTILSLI